MKKKVIGYNRVAKEDIVELEKEFDFQFFKDVNPKSDPVFLKALREAEGVIGLALPVDRELLDLAPNLKIVSNVSTGHNNLDLEEMTKRGVMGTNTPGILDDTTADAIFSILLATARRVPELDAYVKNGRWNHILEEDQYGTNVHHKTLGIIGMGKIGSLIAKRAYCGFDMNILYHNRSRNTEAEEKYEAEYRELDTLLQESDFVCLMTPLTPETRLLIGKREFQLMKKSAIFINGSRGYTVNEADLIEALEEGEIHAAGLDVFQQEPINPDNPLLKMNHVVTTPHIGSSTVETELAISNLAAKNLRAGLAGQEPPNLLNKEVWGKSPK